MSWSGKIIWLLELIPFAIVTLPLLLLATFVEDWDITEADVDGIVVLRLKLLSTLGTQELVELLTKYPS
jgi:hypothetical protein